MQDKLDTLDFVVLDGATGTELEKMGYTGIWEGNPIQLSEPDVLLQIHTNYLDRGADLIIANTYSANRNVISNVKDAIDSAVRVAKKAVIGKGGIVAGSISNHPAGGKSDAIWPSEEQELANYTESVILLIKNDVDVIFAEMLMDQYHSGLILRAYKDACDLLEKAVPFYMGLTVEFRNNVIFLRDDDVTLADYITFLKSTPYYELIKGYNIMHSPIETISAATVVLRDHGIKRIGAYPNQGIYTPPFYNVSEPISVKDFLKYARIWRDQGVSMIGGCCGFGPEYIEALSALRAETIH